MTADLLFRWVFPRAVPDVPTLVREGWRIEHVDPRYGTVLMSRPAPPEAPTKANRRPQEARSVR